MGYDVYGKHPTSEAGEYFRANIWNWRPLVEYIEEHHPDLAAKCPNWELNGPNPPIGHTGPCHEEDLVWHGLDADDSRELARRLRADLDSGKVTIAVEHYEPPPMPSTYTTFAERLGGEWVIEVSEVSIPPEPDGGVLVGGFDPRMMRRCEYDLREVKVRQFADFLADCGGFRIA